MDSLMSVTRRLKQKIREHFSLIDSLLEPVNLPDLLAKGKQIEQGKHLRTSVLDFMHNFF